MKILFAVGLTALIIFFQGGLAEAEKFNERFGKGRSEFGIQFGYGYTFDLPPGEDRTNIDLLFIFPNYKYNLTGVIGSSILKGSLYWLVEAGGIVTIADPDKDGVVTDEAPNFQLGFSPLLLEYKFLSPDRRWAPYIMAGGGFSWGDLNDGAIEISTAFQFVLHAGAGVEYFRDANGSWSLNYRLFHLSNSNIDRPNIGLNSHVFSLGFSF